MVKARTILGVAAALALLAAPAAQAADIDEDIVDRIEAIEQELQALKSELAKTKQEAQSAKQEAQSARKQAEASDYAASKWHLAGYASTSFKATDLETEDPTFVFGTFNPVFHYQYKDLLLFEGELEFEVEEDGSTTVAVEYASLDFFPHDNLAVVAGMFLSPLGQFQERLHPHWINKLPDRPAGFTEGAGALPLNDIGLMLRGGVALEPTMVNYSIYVANGPQVELESGKLEKVELESFGGDDNSNKAVGGRIGILPVPYIEIGVSFLTSQIRGKKDAGIAGELTEGDYTLWGVDLAYTREATDLRFEYFTSELGSFFSQAEANTPTQLIGETDWEGWYVQLAYRLYGATDTPVLRNFEPVIRYGEFDVEGFDEFVEEGKPEDRFTFGLNYWFAPSIVVKGAVSWRDFRNPGAENATEYRTQLAYGF